MMKSTLLPLVLTGCLAAGLAAAQKGGLDETGPYEPTRGGAETMYPEYRTKLKKMPIDKP